MSPFSKTVLLLILAGYGSTVHCLPQRRKSSNSVNLAEVFQHRIVNRVTESSRIIFETESPIKTTSTQPPVRPSPLQQRLDKCEKHCVPLDICPSLFALLQAPTDQNIQTLKKSACGFTSENEPMVWCDDAVCLDRAPNDRRLTLELELSGDESPVIAIPAVATSTESIIVPVTPKNTLSESLNQNGCGEAVVSDRIQGGKFASRGEHPWMVSIVQNKDNGMDRLNVNHGGLPFFHDYIKKSGIAAEISAYCTGALISEDWILTAAHCIADEDGRILPLSHVRIGAWNISNDQELGALDVRIHKYVPHPNYQQKPKIRNDIALLKLVEKVALNSVTGLICLPNAHEPSPVSRSSASAAGWGADESLDFSSLLRKTWVKVVDPDSCVDMFHIFGGSVDPSTQICAQGDHSDSCRGDSGGPLMVSKNGKIFAIGVVSYGSTYCDGSFPAVYTKVSEYMPWIRDTIMNNE